MFICFSSQLFVFCEVHGGEEFFSSAKVRFIAKVPITRDINKKKAYTTIQCEFFLFFKAFVLFYFYGAGDCEAGFYACWAIAYCSLYNQRLVEVL